MFTHFKFENFKQPYKQLWAWIFEQFFRGVLFPVTSGVRDLRDDNYVRAKFQRSTLTI